MTFLSLEDICEINKEWIDRYGGWYIPVDNNLCHRASLEYILHAIQLPIFGIHRFPSLLEKAAALAWWIIEGHIFNDGNKRTGMQAAIELLEINGTLTNFDSDSVVRIATKVGDGKLNIQELAAMFATYSITASQ